MLPDRVSNLGPLTYESGALPIALRGPTNLQLRDFSNGPKNKFKIAVINEPPVVKPLKVYCSITKSCLVYLKRDIGKQCRP